MVGDTIAYRQLLTWIQLHRVLFILLTVWIDGERNKVKLSRFNPKSAYFLPTLLYFPSFSPLSKWAVKVRR